MRKICSCLLIVVMCLSRVISIAASQIEEEVFYSNDLGLTLTEREYNEIINYIPEADLVLFNEDEIAYIMSDVEKNVIASEEIYIKTMYNVIDGEREIISEEYISKEEMLDSLNVKNIDISNARGYLASARVDNVETNMKSIVMNMYSVDYYVKKVYLTCTWLSIPQCKSFDVIGFRLGGSGYQFNIKGTNNAVGHQYYDGKTITYNHDHDNIIFPGNGAGFSTNIVDSVSSSLKVDFSISIRTDKDPLIVYGTYQHATSNVTLSQSQDYEISFLGMGEVLNFDSSVYSKYDNTPGLIVTGSWDTTS